MDEFPQDAQNHEPTNPCSRSVHEVEHLDVQRAGAHQPKSSPSRCSGPINWIVRFFFV